MKKRELQKAHPSPGISVLQTPPFLQRLIHICLVLFLALVLLILVDFREYALAEEREATSKGLFYAVELEQELVFSPDGKSYVPGKRGRG